MKTRKATMKDIPRIYKIINTFANQDLLLPRSFNELYENLRDFLVVEKSKKICACGSLHIVWDNLAEIKSLAVIKAEQQKGIGTKLVKTLLKEANLLKIKKIFVLTKLPGFFEKFGFKKVRKNNLPRKIWSECIKCPKFPKLCDEVPLILELS